MLAHARHSLLMLAGRQGHPEELLQQLHEVVVRRDLEGHAVDL